MPLAIIADIHIFVFIQSKGGTMNAWLKVIPTEYEENTKLISVSILAPQANLQKLLRGCDILNSDCYMPILLYGKK